VNTPLVDVLKPGLLTTVQEPFGRLGARHLGVSPSGCLDWAAGEAANRLVGNPLDAGLLEITLLGPRLRFRRAAVIALTGADLGARIVGAPSPLGQAFTIAGGSELEFGRPVSGARAYLAFAGGIDVPAVLGSCATDLASAFGGLEGRPLRAGDLLSVGPTTTPSSARWGWRPAAAVRLLPGPHADRLGKRALEALTGHEWQIAIASNRMGYRLDGPPLPIGGDTGVPSLPLPPGAIQVTPAGQPIVMLADRQPTGGYAVVACVISADLPALAQLAPGAPVRLALTTPEEARESLRTLREALAALSNTAPA
jgi:antagonist of KipI